VALTDKELRNYVETALHDTGHGARHRAVMALHGEIERLKDVINNDTYCAYCGHAYPRGTPKARNAALTAHIKVCPEHPMRRLEAEVADLQARLAAKEQGGQSADHREATAAV
jgi:hypothetical protein